MTGSPRHPVAYHQPSGQESLLSFLAELADHEPDDELLRGLTRRARQCAAADLAAIKLLIGNTGWLRVHVADATPGDWEGALIPRVGSVSSLALTQRHPVLLGDVTAAGPADHATRWHGVGPIMLVPLGIDTSDRTPPEGALVLGRRAGRAPFTPADLTRTLTLIRPAWAALHAVREHTLDVLHDWRDRHDRLTTLVSDTVLDHLLPLRATAQSGTGLAAHLESASYRLLRLVVDNRPPAIGPDTLLTRILSVCDTVARPLRLVEDLRVQGDLLPPLPDWLVTVIERWLAAALVAADSHASSPVTHITLTATTHPTAALSLALDYHGTPPERPIPQPPAVGLCHTHVHPEPGGEGAGPTVTLSWRVRWPCWNDLPADTATARPLLIG